MEHKTSFYFNKQVQIVIGWILITALISVFAYNTFKNYTESHKKYFSSIESQEKQSVYNASLLLSELMRPNKELLLATASQLEQLDLNNISEIEKILSNKSSGLTSIGSFYFGRQSDGKLAASNSNGVPKGFNATVRPWYREAFLKQGFVVSNPYTDAISKKLSFSLAVPIYQNKIFKGVLGLDVHVDVIQGLLKSLEYGHSSNFFIINNYGVILVYNDSSKIGINLISLLSYMEDKTLKNQSYDKKYSIYNKVLSNREGNINLIDYSGKQAFLSFYSAPELDWKVLSLTSPSVIEQDLKEISRINLSNLIIEILILILLIVSFISYNGMSRRKELQYLLTHDMLTGLPNRNFLEDLFLKEIAYDIDETELAIMVIDLDDFKFINDTLGHDIGDKTLITVAKLLKTTIDKNGFVFRLGSDEFAVLIKNCDIDKAQNIAKKLQSVIYNSPITIDNYSFDISLSIGVTTLGNTKDLKNFLTLADVALHNAKEQGKNRVACVLPELIEENINELDRANEIKTLIKQSIKEERFILHFQPIMDLKENKISHYEALVRLYDTKGTLVPPALFIPIAEKFGLISSIDKWVFKTVLNTLKNNPAISVFMNISGVSLNDNALLEYFETSILESGLGKDNLRLGIEITETAATKNFILAESWLNKFRALGCLIAIDDFGVGYTSFTYLRTLPVDFIKIDGSFVKNIDLDGDHKAIVDAINTLAHTLGKKTIAEFIESESIMKTLQDLGVCYGQGYYIGRPSPLN